MDTPVSYDDYKAAGMMDLGEGALRDFCAGTMQRWQDAKLVQVLAVHKNKSMTVTDGVSTARVFFASSTANNVAPGTVVELIGLRRQCGRLHFDEPNVVLDPYSNDIPIVSTDNMDQVEPPADMAMASSSSSSSSAQSSLPDAFVAHMQNRKRAASDAPVSASKSATVEAVEKPEARNPVSQCTHVTIDKIYSGRDGFVVGPVVIQRVVEGGMTARGKNSPSKLLVCDADGNRIWYSTFSKSSVVMQTFDDWQKACYFLARGLAKDAWTKDEHPCEVNFQLDDGSRRGTSDNQILVVRRGTDDELRWVLQQLRSTDNAVPWDSVLRADPRNQMSVIDAIDAQLCPRSQPSVTVTGVVDAVTPATTKGGAPYFKLKLVGRRSADTDMEYLYLSLWSSATVATGQLITLFGPDGYDRRQATNPNMAVSISGVSITPARDFKISTTNETEIHRADSFDENQAALVAVASFVDNDVVTLAELHGGEHGRQRNVYVATPYVTEVRPFKSKAGRVMPSRKVAFIDNSKNQQGNYSTGSMLAFADNPLPRFIIQAGVEQKPAFDESASTGGVFKIEDPAAVVIVLAMGVTLQPPLQQGRNSFVSFRDARYKVIRPEDNDERAERLRAWYAESGHLHFVSNISLDSEYSNMQDDYTALEQSMPSMVGGSSSSSSSSSATPSASYAALAAAAHDACC